MPGDIGEAAVAVVAIESDAAEAGDEQVRLAVVVVVADCCAHGPARIADARFVGDVGEGSVVVVMKERAPGFLAGECHFHAWSVGEVDVGVTVTIVVDKGYAAAHGFNNVTLLGRGEMIEMNTG